MDMELRVKDVGKTRITDCVVIGLFQQLNSVIAASMSVKSSTKLRQILEVRFRHRCIVVSYSYQTTYQIQNSNVGYVVVGV